MEEKRNSWMLLSSRLFIVLNGLGCILLYITVIHFVMLWLPLYVSVSHPRSLEGKLFSYLPRQDEKLTDSATINVYYLPDINRVFLEYKDRYLFYDELFEEVKKDAPGFVTPDGDVTPIQICADESVPLQSFIEVLNICKKSGIQKTVIGKAKNADFDTSKIIEKNLLSSYLPKPTAYSDLYDLKNLLALNSLFKEAIKEKGGAAGWFIILCGLGIMMTGVVFFIRITRFMALGKKVAMNRLVKEYRNLTVFPLGIFIISLVGFIAVVKSFYGLLYAEHGVYIFRFLYSGWPILPTAYKMLVIIVETIFVATTSILIYSYLVNKLNALISDNELSGTDH